jgi:hypothetical protein
MTAVVVPFPITRRRAFIARQASRAASMHPDAGVRYLLHQLGLQAETMRRRGIAEDAIKSELLCMRHAIEAQFPGTLQQPGGEP